MRVGAGRMPTSHYRPWPRIASVRPVRRHAGPAHNKGVRDEPILQSVFPWLRARGGRRAALQGRRSRLQRAADHRAGPRGGRRRRRAGGLSRTGFVGLQLRRPVPPEDPARRLRAGARRDRRGLAYAAVRAGGRHAAARPASAVQLRGRGRRRAAARRGTQELSAELLGVLRGAPVQRGRLRHGRADRPARAERAVRRRAAVRDREHPAAAFPCRDLRGRLGTDPPRRRSPRSPAPRCWSICRHRIS
ncbi:hypothetical protein OJJOAM_001025 [Cupriavidus sp. H18C1]